MPRDESFEPPPDLLGEQHGREGNGRDENDERPQEQLFGNSKLVEQPTEHPDGEKVEAERSRYDRAIQRLPGHPQLDPESVTHQRRRDHHLSDQEGRHFRDQVVRHHDVEQHDLAQKVKAHQEDTAEPHHEELDSLARVTFRDAQCRFAAGEKSHRRKQLHEDGNAAYGLNSCRVERSSEVRDFERR